MAEPDALALIARVAEGSVRDALSLLDQGIAHGASEGVRVEDIRAMLGLSDRSEIIDLFAHAMKGEVGQALELAARLHHAGADAAEMLIELAEFCHFVTRVKLSPTGLDDPAISEVERRRGAELAKALALGPLTRAWQILLKGVDDVKDSPRPLASAEMAIIRLAYAADLPSPEDALRKLAENSEGAPRIAPTPSAMPSSPPAGSRSQGFSGGASALRSPPPPAAVALPAAMAAPSNGLRLSAFEDVVALARSKRDVQLVRALEHDVRLLRFEPGRIEFSLVEGASTALAQILSRKLGEWTGERWMVALASGAASPTLREVADAREAERLSGVAAHPLVRKVMERFPGAKIVDVRAPDLPTAPSAPAPAGDDDVSYSDSFDIEDDL